MNIKDLKPGSYTEVQPLNINNLPQGSYTTAGQNNAPEESLSTKIWHGIASGVTNIANSIEQPVISLAASPVQALAKATGQPDPFQTDNPLGFGGSTVHPSPLSLEAKSGDALKVAGTAAGFATAPASLLGAVGTGAAIGASQMAGDALQKESSASQVIKQGGIGATIGGITGGAFYGIGKLIQSAGDKILKSIIRPTTPDIKDGFSMETVKKFNLGGSLQSTYDKTQNQLNDLTQQLNTKLKDSTETIGLSKVYQDTVKELTDSSKFKGFGANTKVMASLDQLQAEISALGEGNLSIPNAQLVKQASGHFGAWQYGKQDAESKASEIVYNTFYNKLKTAIEDASPAGVKDINKQLSELIPVMNAVIRRMPVAERSNLISLNSMIGLVGTAANPAAALPTVLSLLSKSGTAGNLMSKVGPSISNQANKAALASGLLGQQVLGTERTPPQEVSPSSANDTTLGTSVNPDGSLTFKGPLSGKDITFDPNMALGIEKLGASTLGRIAKRVHLQDLGEMRDVVDFVGGAFKTLSPQRIEEMASTLWERYLSDYPFPKTMKGFANGFARLLDARKVDQKITK